MRVFLVPMMVDHTMLSQVLHIYSSLGWSLSQKVWI